MIAGHSSAVSPRINGAFTVLTFIIIAAPTVVLLAITQSQRKRRALVQKVTALIFCDRLHTAGHGT